MIPDLKDIHDKYLELGSLDKTTAWMSEELNYKINRQRLSKEFKRRGLFVAAPSGWAADYWVDYSVHLSPISRLACRIIEEAWQDMLAPTLRIHYLSAAAFLASDFYESCLATIMQNVKYTMVTREMLPQGIDLDEVIVGNELYSRGYSYWVGD